MNHREHHQPHHQHVHADPWRMQVAMLPVKRPSAHTDCIAPGSIERARKLREASETAIICVLRQASYLSTPEVAKAVRKNESYARKVLKRLAEEGRIEFVNGVGTRGYWRFPRGWK